MRVYCFPPIETVASTVLIVGSMPGRASLQATQYYAHPRNLFWPIMADLCNVEFVPEYESKIALLKQHGIALWDVLASCVRESSLDADIDKNSMVANDFVSFFRNHPRITHVFFNGAAAETAYRKYVIDQLPEEYRQLSYLRLPSTSPAHAALSYSQKLDAWRGVIQTLNREYLTVQEIAIIR